MRGRTLAIVIGGLVLLLILHLAGVMAPVENGLRVALMPVAEAGAAIGEGVRDHLAPDPTNVELQHQVAELEAQLASVSVDAVQLQALQEENGNLRDLANFLKGSTYDEVGARVIARSSDPQHATLLIDRGANDGIAIGMAVVAGHGIYVGKITSLASNVSTVTLPTDVDSRLAASVASSTALAGVVEGEGNGVARLTFVPQSLPLNTHDLIVTAGTEDQVPANLVVGMVDSIDATATDAFKTATLDPLANDERLDLVAVLRSAALRPN